MHNIGLGIIIAVLFIALLVIFCMILIKLYAHKIKSYTKLLYEKEIQSQKALNAAIHETQEQTLNDISQDLHDDAGQQLTYINFQLENLKLDSPEMQNALAPISESVSRLSESVRSISHSLNNQLLLQQDLFKAIKAETERLKKNTAIKIAVTADHAPRDFNPNEKIIIYRIFQEIINNCLKHAKAKSIEIRLQANPFNMSITDDGIGFEPGHDTATLGLQGMINRAKIINYVFQIESKPGDGTTATLSQNS